ncbi:MAG: CD225/dispanin family protein [Pyrinomonadaceae bacterium]
MFLKTGDPKLDEIPTHVIWSLVALLFCCFPGAIAVYYSMRAIDDKKKGDAFNAREHARSAKIFVVISYALAVIVMIFQLLGRYL